MRLEDLRRVYCNSLKASAGTGNMLSDTSGEYMYIHLPKYRHRQADELITVTGDSMEPTFHDGDTLLVEHTATLREGEIGIFTVDGQGYVKEYHRDGLHSHNPAYAVITFQEDEEVRCVGRVLCTIAPEQFASEEEVALMEERRHTRRPRKNP